MQPQYLMNPAHEIQRFLDHLADGQPEWHLYSALRKYGRYWTLSPNPRDIGKGESKQCFANSHAMLSAMEVTEPSRYRYAEGWAADPDNLCIPIHHAWLVNEDGHVLDWTWDHAPETAYFGFSFPTHVVLGRARAEWGMPMFHHDAIRRAHFVHPLRRRKPNDVLIDQLADVVFEDA